MKVNRRKLSDELPQFKEALLRKQDIKAWLAMHNFIQNQVVPVLKLTLNDNSATDEEGFKDARIKTYVDTEINKKGGVRVIGWVGVQDGQSNRHKVWHLINYGTADRLQTKTVVFKERKENRTEPGTSYAKNFAGYTGKMGVIVGQTGSYPGTMVKGIKPRGWYASIIKTWSGDKNLLAEESDGMLSNFKAKEL